MTYLEFFQYHYAPTPWAQALKNKALYQLIVSLAPNSQSINLILAFVDRHTGWSESIHPDTLIDICRNELKMNEWDDLEKWIAFNDRSGFDFKAIIEMLDPSWPEGILYEPTYQAHISYQMRLAGFPISPFNYNIGADWEYNILSDADLMRVIPVPRVSKLPYIEERRDCFSPESPLLVRIAGRSLSIKKIKELKTLFDNGVLIETLSKDRKWQSITNITEKISDKKQVIVAGYGGVIITTDDHKYIQGDNYNTPSNKKFAPTKHNAFLLPHTENFIDPDFAWLLGYFCADGYARRDKKNRKFITFSDTTEGFINKTEGLLSKYCPGLFKRTNYPSDEAGNVRGGVVLKNKQHKIVFNPYGNKRGVRPICNPEVEKTMRFFETLYNQDKEKIVPDIMLTAQKKAKEAFLSGYWDGNGEKDKGENWKTLSVPTAVLAYQLWHLFISVGYDKVYISKNTGKMAYTVAATFNSAIAEHTPEKVKSVAKKSDTVYDITVEDGVFLSGKYMIKNCDDFVRAFLGWMSKKGHGNTAIFRLRATMEYRDGTKEPHQMLIAPTKENHIWIWEPQAEKYIWKWGEPMNWPGTVGIEYTAIGE